MNTKKFVYVVRLVTGLAAVFLAEGVGANLMNFFSVTETTGRNPLSPSAADAWMYGALFVLLLGLFTLFVWWVISKPSQRKAVGSGVLSDTDRDS
ncbi:hypothetical protein ICL81_03620 [Leucobacter sp. cx-328]|uniref:hypothetical protein n=1 Tax=unclassified Leucobacter TaxID=2621730 RepID=UPI00165DBD50|nr:MULTISPECIES: hypothetical protein [unclassified Leucobacter]MBC9943615.1 hypothetical protein [Leucobacter sp. cx-328]